MDDDLELFRESIQHLVREGFSPQQERWRNQHRPDLEAWRKAGDTGMLLTDIPEQYGGGGGSYAHEAVVLEELARASVCFGNLVQSIVAHYVLAYGTEAQKRAWLPPLARGELVGAIAMSEPAAGSDLQSIRTTARRDGDSYVINGSKIFITNGFHAGLLCLLVKTNPKLAGPLGMSLIMVETRDLPGYRVGRSLDKIGSNAQDTCELFFDEVRVPAANLLGPSEGNGVAQMMEQLPRERLSFGVLAVATAEAAVNVTTRYVKDRVVFGKPLIELQNTRFRLAECRTVAHVGRVFLDNCIQQYIAGELDLVTAAMAKYWLTTQEGHIVDECLQLHGGYGYMTEYPIALMWTDSRWFRIGGGTDEIMKELIGWSM